MDGRNQLLPGAYRSGLAVEILGSAEHVPGRPVLSAEMDHQLGIASGWIERHTGVVSRAYVADGESVIFMGVSAARSALANAGLAAVDLDAVVAVGSVPAQAIPCTAAFYHRELGLAKTGCAAFDVNATCLGFLAALDLLAPSLALGRYRHVLIIASEVASMGLNWEEPATAGLFGDGAAAVVLGPARRHGAAVLATSIRTYSEGVEYCQVRAGGTLLDPRADPDSHLAGTYFSMNGRDTYRLAATIIPNFLKELAGKANVALPDIDTWVVHQASGQALQHLQKLLELPSERFVWTLPTHGNQISASLPIAYHHALLQGRLKAGSHVALVGTGAGLSVGGAILRV